MNFTDVLDLSDVEVPEFIRQLKRFKERMLDDSDEPSDEYTEIIGESIDQLAKELEGETTITDTSKDKKRKILPHLALVMMYMDELLEVDEDFEEFDYYDEDLNDDELEEVRQNETCSSSKESCQKEVILNFPSCPYHQK